MNKSKVGPSRRRGDSHGKAAKAAQNNRADQLNPNNPKYYKARGLEGRPNPSPDGNPCKCKRGKR